MIRVPADIRNMESVLNSIECFLNQIDASDQVCFCVRISAEEIFTNIASYAYVNSELDSEQQMIGVSLSYDMEQQEVMIRFEDRGIPYDPLSKQDPDFDIPFEDRPVGGLGIFMVKRYMDQIDYQYENGCNVLILRKKL